MALVKVRHRKSNEFLEVEGLGRVLLTDTGLVANRRVLEPVGLTSLQQALLHFEHWVGTAPDIFVTDEEEAQIDDDSQIDLTRLVFSDGRLLAETFAFGSESQPEERLIRDLIAPILRRERMEVAEIHISQEKWGWGVHITLEVPIRGQSAGEALRRADAVREMVEVGYAQKFDVGSAATVIRAGHPELLIGLFENDWLEAKRAPYRLSLEVDQYKLAKVAASFANAKGGLMLIGAVTKRRPQGDEIHKINECLLAQAVPADLRLILEKRVHPRIEGLDVTQISLKSSERGVVLIQIPRQSDSQKPFLVSGTRNEDDVSELGFTYAVREGEGTQAPRIEVVHQLIRAGKAALAREGSLSEVEELRSDIERLKAANLESWVSDIVLAAARNGFHVRQDGDSLIFRKGDAEPIRIQATSPGPPADLLHRQQLLEWLADLGLPVRRNVKGFLEPLQD